MSAALSPEGYNPNRLLDVLLSKSPLRSDAALARALEIQPTALSKIRHHRMPIGASLMIRMHELSGLSIHELRDLMGDRRGKYRLADTAWTDAEREEHRRSAEAASTT